jgi:hypothetical protein
MRSWWALGGLLSPLAGGVHVRHRRSAAGNAPMKSAEVATVFMSIYGNVIPGRRIVSDFWLDAQ